MDIQHNALCHGGPGTEHYVESVLSLNTAEDNNNTEENSLRHLIQLRGGGVVSEGNVFVDGKPVCDGSWDLSDAVVTCRMLG